MYPALAGCEARFRPAWPFVDATAKKQPLPFGDGAAAILFCIKIDLLQSKNDLITIMPK